MSGNDNVKGLGRRRTVRPRFRMAWLVGLGLVHWGSTAHAQDQVASIPWRTGGFSDIGAGYDMLSGTPMRTVVDFEVPGSVGKYKLRLARTLVTNTATEGGKQPGPMSQWIFDFHYTAFLNGGDFHIRYPNGTRATQRDVGLPDRILNSDGNPLLLLADGGRVEFSTLPGEKDFWVGTRIVDPYGVALTITPHSSFGPRRITDASGRYVDFVWSGNGVTQVTSSAGQQVFYSLVNQVAYRWPLISRADYSDGTHAEYTYSGLNESCSVNLPLIFDDVRAASKMQYVRYTWRRDSLSTECTVDAELASDGAVVTRRRGGGITDLGYGYWQDLPSGESSGYFYEGTHLVEKFDFVGNRWKYGYDARRFLSSIIDPNGGATTLVNEPTSGRPRRITYADGRSVSYTYTSSTDPYHLASKTDERGNVTTFQRHSNNVLRHAFYPDDTHESWANLNVYGQPRTHVLRNGATERFIHDSMGRLVTHWLPSFVGDRASITYTYYPDGHAWEDRVATVTDPLGRVTKYEYDIVRVFVPPMEFDVPRSGRGLVTKITYPDGSTKSFRYTNYGKERLATDELGNTTTTTYDEYQRAKMVTDPLGQVTTFDYRHKSNLSPLAFTNDLPAKITQPSGKAQTLTYDAVFRLLSKTEGSGAQTATTRFVYDSRDNVIRQTDPMSRATTYGYDERNRMTRRTDVGALTTTFRYDEAGNLVRTIHPDQTANAARYDSMNRMVARVSESNLVTTYEYTGDDDLLWVIDPTGKRTGYQYDAEGRVIQRNSPGVTSDYLVNAVYTYDLAGNLVSRVDNRNIITTYAHDVRDREVSRTYSNATPGITTVYDAASRVTQKSSEVSTLDYTYDAAGRITSERQRVIGGFDKTVSYTYDADDNRDTLSSPDVSLLYSYTSRNEVGAISDRGPGLVLYLYNLAGQPATKILGNGSTATYSYNAAGWLSKVDETDVPDRDYEYDVRGRRIEVRVRNGIFIDEYEYRPDSQLTEHKTTDTLLGFPVPPIIRTETFAYDDSGNRTTATATGTYRTNGANQYTQLAGDTVETFSYDEVGNMVRRGDLALAYDAESRLRLGGDMDLRYDPIGRLVKIATSDSGRTALYDGPHPIAWYDDDGNLLEKTLWGARGDEPFYTYRPSSDTSLYWHLDHQNSVVAVTDAEQRNLEVYLYKPFGEVQFVDPTTNSWRFRPTSTVNPLHRFTGQLWLEDLDVSHYRARAYDPRLGRFLQHDPTHLDAGDPNLYRYVLNNPANFIDPTGEAADTIWDVANVLMDCYSLAKNVSRGNWSSAAADAGALVLDGAATVVPFLPGGAGAALKATRSADNAVTAMKGVEKVSDATKVVTVSTPKKILGPSLDDLGAKAVSSTTRTPKTFSEAKQALVDMAKSDKRTGMTKQDMQAYKDLNKELPDPFPENKVHGPERHPDRPHGKDWHGHVGPVDHIPIRTK